MNPLSLPWSGKKEPEPEQEPVPNYIGLRNQAVREEVGAELKITIEVRGIRGYHSSSYEVAYSERAPLRYYFNKLKLKRAAAYSAVRDMTNLPAGRLRSSYIPQPGALILLSNANISSALQYQRTSIDAHQVALNMGKEDQRPSPKVVEARVRK